jgi:uncharacterized membrane protein SpoIIM required for sporulation
MDLNDFLRERRPRWRRLGELLDRVRNYQLGSLSPREVDELFSLYRLTSSDLNLVQTRTGNPSLVEYLEELVGQAYAVLSVPRRASFFRSWWMIVRHYFPAALRAERRIVAVSAMTLLAGILFGFVATLVSPRSVEVFLPAEHLTESPHERVARLEQSEREGNRSVGSADQHAVFTVFLFNNNIRVSVLGFALGLTFGIGTIIVLFYNGAMLGSIAALYLADHEMKFFIAWVGPHGVIELPCVVFACAAGLLLARTQLRRSEGTTLGQIRAIRPKLVDLLVGTSTLLVIAGTIEGGFSQINQPTISYWFKIGVAIILFILLLVYIFVVRVKPRPAAGEAEATLALPPAPAATRAASL